jgi:GAF domain-containing protein
MLVSVDGADQDASRLADELAALRRVAELVAAGASRTQVFDAVVEEGCRLFDGHFTALLHYEPDGRPVIVAMHGEEAVKHTLHVGQRLSGDGDGVVERVRRTGRAARIENYIDVRGTNAATARDLALTSGVGAPITVEGRVWGVITVLGSGPPLSVGAEARLEMFATLVATAISNAQARSHLVALADEQAAVRRVAELVARGVGQQELFDQVAAEASELIGGHGTTLIRRDGETTYIAVAVCDGPAPIGTRLEIASDDEGVVREIVRTRRPARLDEYRARAGPVRARDDYGVGAGAGVPIIVDDQLWGILLATTDGQPLPLGTESRLAQFAELVAAALANVRARDEVHQLAAEQAALRRVAELVARNVVPEDVFASVAAEAARLLGGEAMTLTRFVSEQELVVEAASGGPAPIGTLITFEPETLPDWVRRENRVVRVDDYTRERDAELAVQFGLIASVAAPISVQGKVWGMLTATSSNAPLPAGVEHRLQQFAELVSTALANSQARAEVQALADEQTALRHVAELAAREAPAEAVLEAVTVQASGLAGVDFTTLLRFEPDGSTEIVAVHGAPGNITVGMRASGDGDGATQRVWRTGRAARADDLSRMSGRWPQVAHGFGFAASAAVPILFQQRLWGVLVVVARDHPLPRGIEERLMHFGELASTAISAAEARKLLQTLAEEQSALRRVAELAARGAAIEEVFDAVAAEVSRLLENVATVLLRSDQDHATVVATCNSPSPVGLRVPALSGSGIGEVMPTGRPFRVDSYEHTTLGDLARRFTAVPAIAVPIIVEGRVWGSVGASGAGSPLPVGTEERLVQFADIAAAAIANAENKEKLTASRARVVATGDEARRRLQRDLHDGAQQRLVHTLITLRRAKDAAADDRPAAELIDEALGHAERANRELRDLVRGILPASLTRGGLRTGIESLVDEIPIPVAIDVATRRLSPPTETTAYFIVAEALTNVVKHAHATHALVTVQLSEQTLSIDVRDDGGGGADPSRGTGLTGLLDRVEASGGTLRILSSPASGTELHASLPLDELDLPTGPAGRSMESG